MFNHKYEIRPSFYLDPASLRRRFQICGLAHLVFMPFLVFFVTMLFGLKNAYNWKSTKEYLGPREWSDTAKWTFREFNELPHVFERRLAPSYKSAEHYLGLFGSNEYIAAVGRVLVFIGGSFGAVLFAFAAINDAILLHVKIANWNLLWYAGLFGIFFSGGKALIPKPEAQSTSSRNLYAEIDEALETVSTFTHYMPETWKKRGWEMRTHYAFSAMYKYKAKLFASEVLSLIMAPYILAVSLANCSEAICEFVVATKADIHGAGEVCGYATFDFDTFNDEGEARNDMIAGSLAESIMQTGSICEATRRVPRPKARMGKMKHSLASFQVGYPEQCVCSWFTNTLSTDRRPIPIGRKSRRRTKFTKSPTTWVSMRSIENVKYTKKRLQSS
jgi:autophagy-related protein 9